MTTLRILLDGTVDYAGLFPPAGLDMVRSVENYRRYMDDACAWMLGRFVVPVARLGEFKETLSGTSAAPWRLSVLIGENPEADAREIAAFNRQNANAVIDSAEARAAGVNEIERIAGVVPAGIACFVELAPEAGLGASVAALARLGLNAKIRTGGVTPDMIPDTAAVASFIATCRDHDVPFKATAGLHHPIRAVHKLTYEPDSVSGKMLGFLNVFVATALAQEGSSEDTIRKMIGEEDADAIDVTEESITWCGTRLGADAIRKARDRGIRSFGSCSFEEPVRDLKGMHLI
ncbi:MAG: hypothetical protein O7D32_00140 [bacterium]|nr:hypothetical protein [bacterium]